MLREYFEISLRIASVSVPDNTSAFACLFSAYLKWGSDASRMIHCWLLGERRQAWLACWGD
jgi:hypothetical protein